MNVFECVCSDVPHGGRDQLVLCVPMQTTRSQRARSAPSTSWRSLLLLHRDLLVATSDQFSSLLSTPNWDLVHIVRQSLCSLRSAADHCPPLWPIFDRARTRVLQCQMHNTLLGQRHPTKCSMCRWVIVCHSIHHIANLDQHASWQMNCDWRQSWRERCKTIMLE